jgi:3-polyprenyl-4-hydroxybenzoate decarboxylase
VTSRSEKSLDRRDALIPCATSDDEGPLDDLDDACDIPAYGGKMGIDATRNWASEGTWRLDCDDEAAGGAPPRSCRLGR